MASLIKPDGWSALQMGGAALSVAPDALGMVNPDSRMCCGAGTCFGCVYVMDVCFAMPVMRRVETDEHEQFSLLRLPFYEVAWPCMGLMLCLGTSQKKLQRVSNSFLCPWTCCRLVEGVGWF
jgi:hypothetical protein